MKPSRLYKTGDIIFLSGKGWISKAIKAITFGKASHVALVCGSCIYETDGAWRKSKWSDLDKYDKDDITVFRISSFTDEHKFKLFSVCEKRIGTKYSYWDCAVQGLFSIFNPKLTQGIADKIDNPLRTKCDEETQICHNLARGKVYFNDVSGKNPQTLMEELLKSDDAEIVYSK